MKKTLVYSCCGVVGVLTLILFVVGITVLFMEVKTHGVKHIFQHVILNQHLREFHDDGKDCEYDNPEEYKGSPKGTE